MTAYGFNVEKKIVGDSLILSMSGSVDESFFVPALDDATFKLLVLDLEKVDLINSRGIIRWARWLNPLSQLKKIAIRHCPKMIVDQMNSIQGFLPKTIAIESFFVPYFCESCDASFKALFTQGKEFKLSASGPVIVERMRPCPSCKKMLDIDAIDSVYFSFLKR
jgi:hypothetical protein